MGDVCVLFCSIDSTAPDWKHGRLRQEKGLLGLPSIAFLDADGEVLVQVPARERTVEGFLRTLRRSEDYVRLRKAATEGDPDAAARFLLMQLEEHRLKHPEAQTRRTALDPKLEPELLAAIDLRLLDLEVSAAVQKAGQAGRSALGPRFLAMLREGPRPSPHVTRGFWFAILEWAERERDVEAFAEGLAGMRRALEVTDRDETWVPGLLGRYETTLAELKK